MVRRRSAKQRRLARRLKAGASIALALAAGTFVACARKVESMSSSGETGGDTPDASDSADATTSGSSDAAPTASAASSASSAPPSSAAPPASAAPAASSALVPAKPAPKKPAFDGDEHKKGMPVIDNLLE